MQNIKTGAHVLICMGCTFLIYGNAFAVEAGGSLKNEIKWNDNNTWSLDNTAKIEMRAKNEDFYSQITLAGEYNGKNANLEIDRAFTELYFNKAQIVLGRQRVYWGVGNLFNYADVFNTVDLLDPKGDKKGIDSLKAKLSWGESSRLEAVAVLNDSSKLDYAMRIGTTISKFEVLANFIKVKPVALNAVLKSKVEVLNASLPPLKRIKLPSINNRMIIVETRGEVELGIWAQLVYKWNDKTDFPKVHAYEVADTEKIATLGLDYTFLFGADDLYSLYVLSEYNYNDASKTKYSASQYKFKLNTETEWSQNFIFDVNNKSSLLSSNVSYLFNDYITLNVAYNKYLDAQKSSLLASGFAGVDNEIVLAIKSTF